MGSDKHLFGPVQKNPTGQSESHFLSKEGEIRHLKEQAGALRDQIEAIDSKIRELEERG